MCIKRNLILARKRKAKKRYFNYFGGKIKHPKLSFFIILGKNQNSKNICWRHSKLRPLNFFCAKNKLWKEVKIRWRFWLKKKPKTSTHLGFSSKNTFKITDSDSLSSKITWISFVKQTHLSCGQYRKTFNFVINSVLQ